MPSELISRAAAGDGGGNLSRCGAGGVRDRRRRPWRPMIPPTAARRDARPGPEPGRRRDQANATTATVAATAATAGAGDGPHRRRGESPVQGLAELPDRREAIVGVLLQARRSTASTPGPNPGLSCDRRLEDPQRPVPGQQLIHQGRHRVLVGPLVDLEPILLLGGDVAERPHRRRSVPVREPISVSSTARPKSVTLGVPSWSHQDVLGLQVPVQDAVRVQAGQGLGHRHDQRPDLVDGQRPRPAPFAAGGRPPRRTP